MQIAELIKARMVKEGVELFWFGKPSIWGGAHADATGKKPLHPINEWQAVLKAVSNSSLFVKSGRIKAVSWSGKREIYHPCFKLHQIDASNAL